MSELVTGDAVVLDLRIARPASRFLALFIDLAIQFMAWGTLMVPIATLFMDRSEAFVGGVVIAFSLLIFVGYNVTMETLTRGKTVGKIALGLRVVRDDGGAVRFRQALVRALAGIFIDFFLTLGIAGFVTAMLNPQGKRVGDLLAGTLVVRERAPASFQAVPETPEALLSWAGSADLSRIPDSLALSVRSYLIRWHELSSTARDRLGERLREAASGYVTPPPPVDVPTWAYLAAIVNERARRSPTH